MKSFDVKRNHAAPSEDTSSAAPPEPVAQAGPVRRPIVGGLAFADQRSRGPRAGARAEDPIRRLVSVRGRYGVTQALESPTKLDDDVELLIQAVDAKTQQAWRQVLAQPLFSKLAGLASADGHIALWIAGVDDLRQVGHYPGLMAAEFGYAVESLSTHLLGSGAAGWTLDYQVAAGRTRPDIVARKDARTVWLDLTAGSTASSGHIYSSKGWHSPAVCPWPHAEITYPALDAATAGIIRSNAQQEAAGKPVSTDVDPEALEAEVAAARELLAARMANWKSRFPAAIREHMKAVRRQARPEVDRDTPTRAGLIQWLNTTFGTRLDPGSHEDLRTAGSVLAALDMTPTSFGFVTSTASAARGVAYLLSHDPDLLQPAATGGAVDVEMGEETSDQ
jgi:hypothetical protein